MEYLVGIVGERSYQPAVKRCCVGQPAVILHEVGNPHDANALRVDVAGATVGYLARDSWLRDAIHDEAMSVHATVHAVNRGGPFVGIVLVVRLSSIGVVEKAVYNRHERTVTAMRSAQSSVLSSFVRGLLRGISGR